MGEFKGMVVSKYQTVADLALKHLDNDPHEVVLRADVTKLSRNTYELLEQRDDLKSMLKNISSELSFITHKLEDSNNTFLSSIEYDWQTQFEAHELLTKIDNQ